MNQATAMLMYSATSKVESDLKHVINLAPSNTKGNIESLVVEAWLLDNVGTINVTITTLSDYESPIKFRP
jgi:hypothetical protein